MLLAAQPETTGSDHLKAHATRIRGSHKAEQGFSLPANPVDLEMQLA
jgi:hypothetical protein